MQQVEKGKRNRASTTQRIVEALEEVLAERGLEGVGVNRIAEKANVSKVLIYRYFGGMEGLLDYYVKMGKLFPIFTPTMLDQIRPFHHSDTARIWYRQVIQTYRHFRTFKPAREVLKASIVENDSIADASARAQDEEMTRLVDQLAFVKGGDPHAVSAVIMGAMTYLTLMARNDRAVIGIDLRSEEGWERIENAVKTIYIGLNKMTITSKEVELQVQSVHTPIAQW